MGREADAAERGRAARTRRPFPNFFDGVGAMAYCRDALFMIIRESASRECTETVSRLNMVRAGKASTRSS